MTYGDCQVSDGILGGPKVIKIKYSCSDQTYAAMRRPKIDSERKEVIIVKIWIGSLKRAFASEAFKG